MTKPSCWMSKSVNSIQKIVSLTQDSMTTILTWLNKNQKPEIKCSGFSSARMNLKRIHVIIKVAFCLEVFKWKI